MASKDNSIELAIGALIFGGGLLIHSLRNFVRAQKIQDTAKIDIGSAPQGMVELEAYAWPMAHVMDAVCGRQVVYYHYKVQELVKRGKRSEWVTRYEFNFENPFYVIDSSGACVVNPLKKCMEIKEKNTRLRSYATDIASIKMNLGSAAGFGALFASKYRLVEKKILVGSPVYVHGEMHYPAGGDYKIIGDYKKFLQTAKALKNNVVFQIQKFDTNRDGAISEDELHDGHAQISNETRKSQQLQNIKVSGVISNTENHRMILADCHEGQLLKRLTTHNYLKMIAGIAMICFGVYVLQQRLRF